MKHAYKIIVRKCEGKRPPERRRSRWKDYNKMNVKKLGKECIELAQDWVQ
jgi:hypothetical protein